LGLIDQDGGGRDFRIFVKFGTVGMVLESAVQDGFFWNSYERRFKDPELLIPG
jgi:hypothetical protein